MFRPYLIKTSKLSTNLLYYYYNLSGGKAYNDLANPIVLSIATFRKYNPSEPIYVLDVSPTKMDWGLFPSLLNFHVIRKPMVYDVKPPESKYKINKYLLAKPAEMYLLSQDKTIRRDPVIVCDSDVFFLKNPLPLSIDHTKGICCARNTGYYYFMNGGQGVEEIFEAWCSACSGALLDPVVQNAIQKSTNWDLFNEEVVLWYIKDKYRELNINDIPVWENFWFSWLYVKSFDLSNVKNLHYCVHVDNPVIPRNERGKVCMYIKELSLIVKEVLGNHLYDVIGDFQCKSFSIHDSDKIRQIIGLEKNKL